MSKKIVTGLCKSRASTEDALRQLESAGFTESQISLLLSDDTRGKGFKIVEGSKADEGMAAGATAGGLIGAFLAGIATTGAIVIPGLNLVVAGSLIGGLAGMGAGALSGGLIGTLIGAGIPEHEAKLYEKEISGGNVLIAVEAENDERAHLVEKILKRVDAFNIAA